MIPTKRETKLVQCSTWLGKDVDLLRLRIGNSVCLHARVIAALIWIHRKVVPLKVVSRVIGLIGWLPLKMATSSTLLVFSEQSVMLGLTT